MWNKLRCQAHFYFSANHITWSRLLIQIHILNDKQCRSRSVGFLRSQLIWIYTVCKVRIYSGSAGLGLIGCPAPKDSFFFCPSGDLSLQTLLLVFFLNYVIIMFLSSQSAIWLSVVLGPPLPISQHTVIGRVWSVLTKIFFYFIMAAVVV